MKAVVYEEYGTPDVLKLVEVDKPVVNDDDVLVRIRAASLNPYDWHFLTGLPYLGRLSMGLLKPKCRGLGADLAGEVVTMFYNKREAKKAGKEFDRIFKDKEKPNDISDAKIEDRKWKMDELLVELGLVGSKSEARRMVEQGGVKIDDKKVENVREEVDVKDGNVVQVGKRKFVKIRIDTN